MGTCCVCCEEKHCEQKNLVSEELNKICQCLYQTVIFMARKNQGPFNIKKWVDYWAN